MLLAIGIMMAANEVPRIAQNFGFKHHERGPYNNDGGEPEQSHYKMKER